MKYLLITALFIVWVSSLLAQEVEYGPWRLVSGDTLTIIADTAPIKKAFSADDPSQGFLHAGNRVVLLSFQQQESSDVSVYGFCVLVQYTVNNRKLTGYIRLADVAAGVREQNDVRLLYGAADRTGPATGISIGVKAISIDGSLLDKIVLPAPEAFADNSAAPPVLMGSMGLKNIKAILRMQFSGQACGVPTTYLYAGWTGKKLVTLPYRQTVGELGEYYSEELFLFPAEKGGQPDRIIRITNTGEGLDKTDRQGNPMYKEKTFKEIYRWNGERIINR